MSDDRVKTYTIELNDGTEEEVRCVRQHGTEGGTLYFYGPDEVAIGMHGKPLAPRPGMLIAAYPGGSWRKVKLTGQDPF